jgi:salicylate 5-hydroxylase large subunit
VIAEPALYTRVPYDFYVSPEIYAREQERVFGGRAWNYVALAAELPNHGDFKRTAIGERPVVVVRERDGSFHVVVNKCAHRGVQFCYKPYGNTKAFQCPYHQWTYDLEGNLLGVPFKKGLNGQGGMPADFDVREHGLRKLKVTERHGVIFASFDDEVEPFEEYLGAEMVAYFDRVFDGRELRVLGYQRQRILSNWKLMFENIKDPYHASLLHVFLVTFGLFRADNPSAVTVDETGRHACLISSRGEQKPSEATAEMKSFLADFKLNGPELLQPVREFAGDATVVMQTLWPNLIVQQQSNTIAMRQLVTRGPQEFELHWTYFGYRADDDEMTTRRLRQANLMGPAGYVSIDDSEVMALSQAGVRAYTADEGFVEMGGREVASTDHMVTETAIRGFYKYYREVMKS